MSEGDKLFASEDGVPDSAEIAGISGGMNNSISSGDTTATQSPPPMIQSRHMTALFFHVVFKASAILLYVLSMFFLDSFILLFVLCVLLLAFDFWTVKNITGRLLVGLRWWNEVKEDGSNVWIFESKPDTREVGNSDKIIFWGAMVAAFGIWAFFFLGVFFSLNFKNLLIIGVALALTGANIWGYWKCQRDAGRKIQGFLLSRI